MPQPPMPRKPPSAARSITIPAIWKSSPPRSSKIPTAMPWSAASATRSATKLSNSTASRPIASTSPSSNPSPRSPPARPSPSTARECQATPEGNQGPRLQRHHRSRELPRGRGGRKLLLEHFRNGVAARLNVAEFGKIRASRAPTTRTPPELSRVRLRLYRNLSRILENRNQRLIGQVFRLVSGLFGLRRSLAKST